METEMTIGQASKRLVKNMGEKQQRDKVQKGYRKRMMEVK
jgi:hypothetical protein